MVLEFKNINYEEWSKTWKSSKQPRKQRKYILNAPKHIRGKIMSSLLSEEIRNLVKIRNIPIRVGDYVKILRGKFRDKEGYVIYVDRKRYRIYVDSAKLESKGKEIYYPIHYSKVIIMKLNLNDKKRVEIIKRKGKNLDEKTIEELIKKYSVSEDELKKVMELNKKFK